MAHAVEIAAAVIFVLALIHTFMAARIETLASKFPRHAGLFQFLGEVEAVFGFWALVLCLAIWAIAGSPAAVGYLEEREFTEPRFVFVIMVVAASRPILETVIGGVMTAYAAPPVLMVANAWGWGTSFMAATFGWKAAVAVLINATVFVACVAKSIPRQTDKEAVAARVPFGVTLVHVLFLVLIVLNAHHAVVFVGAVLFFLGFTHAYERHQSPLMLRESLLVAFFLGGLVVLGGLQQWWLQPVVQSMSAQTLFFGATGLTAVMDNAAITYLGSLISGLSEESKYLLVAGAVTGGGLTVIANAPNPAGLGILGHQFADGVSPLRLLGAAMAPTVVAGLSFLLL